VRESVVLDIIKGGGKISEKGKKMMQERGREKPLSREAEARFQRGNVTSKEKRKEERK